MSTALLLLEIQNDYFPNGRTPLEKSQEATNKAQQILQAFRNKKLPIVHAQHISTQPDAAFYYPAPKALSFTPRFNLPKAKLSLKSIILMRLKIPNF